MQSVSSLYDADEACTMHFVHLYAFPFVHVTVANGCMYYIYYSTMLFVTNKVVLNEIVLRGLVAARVPFRSESVGLLRSDGRRPEGATFVSWKRGKTLLWDAIYMP